MRVLSWTSGRNISVELNLSPFLVERTQGIEGPPANINFQTAPFFDGAKYNFTTLGVRPVAIEGRIITQDLSEIETQKEVLLDAFNPKDGPGTFLYEMNGKERIFYAVPNSGPIFPNKPAQEPYQAFLLQFICVDPHFYGIEEYTTLIETYEELFTFPFSITAADPIPMSSASVGEPVDLIVAGNVPSPVTITFYGPAENPKIENVTTGEYIKMNIDLADETEYLIITTEPGNKGILYFNGTSLGNGMQYLDLASTFWQLEPGVNSVKFTDDTSSTAARCQVVYRDKYIGA